MSAYLSSREAFLVLFENVPLAERIRRIRLGLGQPKNSGAYKYARWELMHLLSWFAALSVPLFALVVLLVLSLVVPMQAVPQHSARLVPPPEDVRLDEPVDPVVLIQPVTLPDPSALANSISDSLVASPLPPEDPRPAMQSPPVGLNKSPLHLPLPTQGIGLGRRILESGRHKGSPSDGAVLRALRWLQGEQLADGSWESPKPAMTGLALLCYLGRGEKPGEGEFGETIRAALEWLLANQQADGRFKGRDAHDYSLPIAAYALCEAFAIVRHPSLSEAAATSIRLIVDGQNEGGGWDYRCVPSQRIDTSYSGWCVQALKAARIAGIDVSGLEEGVRRAGEGLKRNAHPEGGFGYTSPKPSHLTGVGVLGMQLAGSADDSAVRLGIKHLNAATCAWDAPMGGRPIYYWYYITQALFYEGGNAWARWDPAFATELIRNQVRIAAGNAAGDDVGYWDSPSATESHGRVYSTTLCTLMLEVYYRYLPSYNAMVDKQEDGPIQFANEPIVRIRM